MWLLGPGSLVSFPTPDIIFTSMTQRRLLLPCLTFWCGTNSQQPTGSPSSTKAVCIFSSILLASSLSFLLLLWFVYSATLQLHIAGKGRLFCRCNLLYSAETDIIRYKYIKLKLCHQQWVTGLQTHISFFKKKIFVKLMTKCFRPDKMPSSTKDTSTLLFQ